MALAFSFALPTLGDAQSLRLPFGVANPFSARPQRAAIFDEANAVKSRLHRTDNAIWRATHEEEYTYETLTGWTKSTDYTLTFDQRGNALTILTDEGGTTKTRTTTTYNDNNKPTEELTEEINALSTVTPVSKRTTSYDERITNLITKRETFAWNKTKSAWEKSGNCYTRTVTRNKDGNVAVVMIAVPYNGVYDPILSYIMTYDSETGRAISYTESQLTLGSDGTSFVWVDAMVATDLVWQNTNGQISGEFSDFYEGDNRLKSATCVTTGSDGVTKTTSLLSATYKDDGSYEVTVDGGGERTYISKTYAENGGYTYVENIYKDADSDGTFSDEEITSQFRAIETCDEQGNATKYEEYSTAEDSTTLVQSAGTITDYVYDAETGATTQMTYSEYDTSTKKYEPMVRVLYSDFIDASQQSGIHDIQVETAVSARFYDLRGVCVGTSLESLPSGFYIQKVNGRAQKVLKR